MRTTTILCMLLLLYCTQANAQYRNKKASEQFTTDVTKITFIEPGIGHEFAVGRNTSFFLRGGMTATPARDYDGEVTGLLYRPFLSTSYRAYYNAAKRMEMEKNTERNSANYIALLFLGYSSPLNPGHDYDHSYNNVMINTGVVWGMQRNYPSGFSLDLNLGLGYQKVGDISGLNLIGEFNIGWCLGKKK